MTRKTTAFFFNLLSDAPVTVDSAVGDLGRALDLGRDYTYLRDAQVAPVLEAIQRTDFEAGFLLVKQAPDRVEVWGSKEPAARDASVVVRLA